MTSTDNDSTRQIVRVMRGVGLASLKELIGQSNISITNMRYVHPTPEQKREAVQKLERYNTEQVFATYETRSGSPQKGGAQDVKMVIKY